MGKLITIAETARRFGMTEQAMRDWIKKGYISVREVGRARYIDEDAILALQDTAKDIAHQQAKLEALRNEVREEYESFRDQRNEEKDRSRYLNVIIGAALRSGFLETVVRLLHVYGELNAREMAILVDYLHGMTLESIGGDYTLSRERIRQIIEKAIRKSQNLTQIEERIKQINDLQVDNEALKTTILGLKEKLMRYETKEQIEKEQDMERKRQAIAENDAICKLLSTNIVKCDLSVRAINCLKCGVPNNRFSFDKRNEGCVVPPCETVGDLCKMSKTDFLKIRNAGKKTLREIDAFLEKNGLTWGMDVDKLYQERVDMIINK